MGKHVEVAAFPASLSSELVSVSDDRELFTPEYFDDLWSRHRSYHNERGAPAGRDTHRSTLAGHRPGGPRDEDYDSASPAEPQYDSADA